MRNARRFRVLLTVAIIVMAARAACAQPLAWKLGFSAESGTPSGFVQVRENRIEGTRLPFRSTLGVSRITSLRINAVRRLSTRSLLHLWLSGMQITGSGTLTHTAYFNGTTLEPGPISADTHFLDDWRFTATYWYRIAGSSSGAGLWLSGGLTYVGLNFKIRAGIAPGSVGHETKEDFITQELPVPTLGVHLRYPLGRRVRLIADATGGRLPRVYSLRHEGGAVTIDQAQWRAQLGLSGRFSAGWRLRVYWFDRYYRQNEQSHEDGNRIKLRSHGFGIGVAHGF